MKNKNQGTTHYIGNSGIAISRLKAFTFKHPPPCRQTRVDKTEPIWISIFRNLLKFLMSSRN